MEKRKSLEKQGSNSSNLLETYECVPGLADELLNADGQIRDVWRPFVDFFSGLTEEQIEKRFTRGDQYLRDAGVFYRQYDEEGSSERDWPLSHIPVIIAEKDWQTIEAGLIQRAILLENVMADLYGPMNLVNNGHLPAELVARSSDWMRPMVGAHPMGGHFLNFLAFEIGRGPDGTWWVLGDRTQAPSGAGFALENRVATSHVFPDYYWRSNTFRLAGFFKKFRDHLQAMSDENDCGLGILTPGRLNDTYFEHAYIARYLGFMLLEGEDITVQNGRAMVRTVDGLKPISVLWRRMDSAFVDPLEFNPNSMIGTPGLANVVRQGKLNMINAPGSGVLESRAMLAFLPQISEAVFNEKLHLPNIATWWCGPEQERADALARSGDMMFGSARSTCLPFEQNEMRSLQDLQFGDQLRTHVEMDGANYVAQETIKLSTTPVYDEGKLIARPMTIRVFLARCENGWEVMPGGYARIGKNKGTTVLALQGGGQVADVWVRSENRVDRETLTTGSNRKFTRMSQEVLPSRAADNLFWLGRYTERAEVLTRLTRAYHVRWAESDETDTALLQCFKDYLEGMKVDASKGIPLEVCNALWSAVGSAGHIRDRFSTDGWMALKDLSDSAQLYHESAHPGDEVAQFSQVLLRKISGFAGLVHESMYHYTGWRFMKIGRALERAGMMTAVLRYFSANGRPNGALDIPVDVGDSLMTHRRRYSITTNRDTVVDLLVLDRNNPRSIIFQLHDCAEHLKYLPGESDPNNMTELSRAMLKLTTSVAIQSPQKVTGAFLDDLERSIYDLCAMISKAYLK